MEKKELKEGWETIDKMLHHLFRNEDYDLAIDYLKKLILFPDQRQPVLVLWSDKSCTGKTSFLHFLKYILNSDMKILDFCRFRNKFNGHWAGKTVVAFDDDSSKTVDDQLVWKLSRTFSSTIIQVEEKGTEPREIINNSKFIICTDSTKWIDRVSVFTSCRYWKVMTKHIELKDEDPDFLKKIKEEIPQFLLYIIRQYTEQKK